MLDTWWLGVYAAAMLAAGLVMLVTSSARRRRDAYLDRIAPNLGVPLPEELRARLRHGQVMRQRILAVAVLAGAAASAGLWLFAATTGRAVSTVIVFAMMISVIAVGVLVAELVIPRAVGTPRAVRVAHSRAVRLDDYVPPWVLATIRIVCVAIAVIAVIAFLNPTSGRVTSPWGPVAAVVAGIASVGSLVLVEVLARVVIARRQDAAGRDELIWGDAIRARALLRAYGSPLLLALWTALNVLPALVTSMLPPPVVRAVSGLSSVYFPVMLAALAICVFGWARSAPEEHFLRRLWPAPAAPAPNPTIVEG